MLDIEILQWLRDRRRFVGPDFDPVIFERLGPFRLFRRRARTLCIGFKPSNWGPCMGEYHDWKRSRLFVLEVAHLPENAGKGARRNYKDKRLWIAMDLDAVWRQVLRLGVPDANH